MTDSKKAAAFERRAQMIETLGPKVEEIRDAMNADPWGFEFDYKTALTALMMNYPADKKLIMELWNAKSK